MKIDYISELRKGFETAYIDKSINSNLAYKPEILTNDYKSGKKMLDTLINELNNCDKFYISVAFITLSGLTPLLEVLKNLEKNNIQGKILTTDYLLFSDPKALAKLKEFSNIELKMFYTDGKNEGFHTKGYIFENDEIYKIIIGSSNLTGNALSLNKEWNTKLLTSKNGEISKEMMNEFNSLWNHENTLDYNHFYEKYKLRYINNSLQRSIVKNKNVPNIVDYKLSPNSMQLEFINNIEKLITSGHDKALLISATGTGKTFASAFAVRHLKAERILFIVHREQIAIQAMNAYKRVFDDNIKMGVLSGNKKDTDSNFIFSTMQTMSKDYIIKDFDKDQFDIIIIDEAHRAGSESYKFIMEYYEPKLWLGMTASPYRTDGFDIYNLFDNNIAHEIRLQQALEDDLLCPFHYFGISDYELLEDSGNLDVLIYKAADSAKTDLTNNLSIMTRIDYLQKADYIIKQAKFYGYSGSRVKGLIFCSTKEEASRLSDIFNEKDLNTAVLTGDDPMNRRLAVIDQLVNDKNYNPLDYIFTVDIFNEGVDIPEINQIILLRPTQSPTIFIQQIGRGLRKYKDKEFTVIIDFIGNYNTNYMIPIALGDDRSYNKDNIRKYVREGNRLIPGLSSISFDEISTKRIYESIDSANFSQIGFLKEQYKELKYKLGKIPSLMDFEKYGSIDVQLFYDNKKLGSYYSYLEKYEPDYKIRFNDLQKLFINYISTKFGNAKRPHELLILKAILEGETKLISYLQEELSKLNLKFNENTRTNIINILTNEFNVSHDYAKYSKCIFIEKYNDDYKVSKLFDEMLKEFSFREYIEEFIEHTLYRHFKYFSNYYNNRSLQLYSKYTYYDVIRLLEWSKNEVAQNIGGYKYDEKTKTFPVFINYNKGDDIAETIKYEDRFINNNSLIALSKSRRNLSSKDVNTILNSQKEGIEIELFVRKNKDDKTAKEFYYLGTIVPTGETELITMSDNKTTAVEIFYKLENPVRDDIFDYITKE